MMRKQFTLFLLSTSLILFVARFADAQETQTVLQPNQLTTFSLATEQERVFVLRMKKGDFAEIQSLAPRGLNLSFEIYDSARKKLLEEFNWFVAPRDGEFILVIKLAKGQYPKISDGQKISIQYNNQFKLPAETKLKAIRKASGFDVEIMSTSARRPITDDGDVEPSRCLTDATLQIGANPVEIQLGQSSVVSWSVGVPAGCSGLRVSLNGEPVAATGSRSVSPPAPAIFRITASLTRGGLFQQTSASTSVRVTYPSRVFINPSTARPAAVLLGALASGNEDLVIELCDVDLDLTGHADIVIGDRRSLIASPSCARGPRSFGPRIFVTDARAGRPLFSVRGDNVLISGFRLEGPTSGIASGDREEKGILIWPFSGATPINNIEISNMEIFHWAGLGVKVVDNVDPLERGRLFNTNERAVRILNNFFHHNRHVSEGYGAVVAEGAYALIARNVFNENRHAIAGGSKNRDNKKDFSGYTARENLILTEGGLACSYNFWARLTAPDNWFRNRCWRTHQIDMHGDDNRFYSGSNWQCGTAGETILMERNTILYTKDQAIKIRGNPADKAVADGNVFKHESRKAAIGQNGFCGWGDNITKPIDVRPNNLFGVDPTIELGKGDFFGDGRLDDFMATGVTWWARSPVTGQWRYLNTMSERLPQLSLERVDGDAVWDVKLTSLQPQTYSKSGTGRWAPVMSLHP